MAKNAFVKQLQAKQDSKMLLVGSMMSQWSSQICMDALVKTLGYGACMGDDPWAEKRIARFLSEWLDNVDKEWDGVSRKPDADAVRVETDRLLQKKVPSLYVPWEARFKGWKEASLEQEVAKFRGLWKRQGLLGDDGGTSKLLQGVGDDA